MPILFDISVLFWLVVFGWTIARNTERASRERKLLFRLLICAFVLFSIPKIYLFLAQNSELVFALLERAFPAADYPILPGLDLVFAVELIIIIWWAFLSDDVPKLVHYFGSSDTIFSRRAYIRAIVVIIVLSALFGLVAIRL